MLASADPSSYPATYNQTGAPRAQTAMLSRSSDRPTVAVAHPHPKSMADIPSVPSPEYALHSFSSLRDSIFRW